MFWGGANNIKKDQRISDDQCGRRHSLILTYFVEKLLKHYTINSLSNIAKISQKALMVYLSRSVYIGIYKIILYRGFLFQLSNSKKIVYYGKVLQFLRHPSTDHMTYGGHWTGLVESLVKRCYINRLWCMFGKYKSWILVV